MTFSRQRGFLERHDDCPIFFDKRYCDILQLHIVEGK